jgi:hypothetical protein
MLVSELKTDISLRTHDVGAAEVTTSQLLTFINMASRDVRNAGWLLPLADDESITEAANDYEHNVPAGFAYISMLLREDTSSGTFDEQNGLDLHEWRLGINTSLTPVIYLNQYRYGVHAGARIKIVGQQRPAIYTADGDTVDNGLESFLRERAAYYSFQFLAAGRSEYAQWRQQQAMLARAESERFLAYGPQQFRMKPNSRYVPGR